MRARVEKVDVLGWNKSYSEISISNILYFIMYISNTLPSEVLSFRHRSEADNRSENCSEWQQKQTSIVVTKRIWEIDNW